MSDNNTANATAGADAAGSAAGADETVGIITAATAALDSLFVQASAFVQDARTDPVAAVVEHRGFLALMLTLLVGLPILMRVLAGVWSRLNEPNEFVEGLGGNVEEEAAELEKAAAEAPASQEIWEIGVSGRSVSVSENGFLRVVEFTKDLGAPTASHIVATLIKAVVQSDKNDDMASIRPQLAVFLESRTCSDAVVAEVAAAIKAKLNVVVATPEQIGAEELSKLKTIRRIEMIRKMQQEQARAAAAANASANAAASGEAGADAVSPSQAVAEAKFITAPNRGCHTCHKEIEGKASQCSACKAVIYCSPACAKQDWPQHKTICPKLKRMMNRFDEWKLNDLPFAFYNSKTQLASYNLVPFLNKHGCHNQGAYRRLCGCFSHVQYGEMSAELIATIQARQPTHEQKFAMLGFQQEMFPLSDPLKAGVDPSTINSWKALYETRGWSMDNPAALVLDIPMTIWFLINEFHLKKLGPYVPGTPPREVTVHMAGVEMEADSLGIFECLLPLIPGVHLAIHMIGPAVSPNIAAEHRSLAIRSNACASSIFVSMSTDHYHEKYILGEGFPLPDGMPEQMLQAFNFGPGKPDLVLILNGGVLQHESWRPTIQALIQHKQKVVFTEQLEQMAEVMDETLTVHLGTSLSTKATPNPFRQPVFLFKRDVNLPCWNNAFYFAIN
ncbi:hypothetical protein BC831DRAFT_444498 [Entophlyctis helioformis]|nr:hypothetical protein BC831DRAFT_444498 [Entophlyctis helioformis]